MRGDLAVPGARAVLIGTGRHDPGSDLPELPTVDATLDGLEHALHDVCGMAAERVTRVPGAAGPDEVVAAVEEAVLAATGPVLLSYVGHGLLGPRDELYLATHASRSAGHIAGAVPYRTLRDLLGEASHGSLVVLDCCFSGRARTPGTGGGARQPFASARPRGSLLLASASHYQLSFAPPGEPHTLFGGRLLRLLTEGDPTGPPWLTADRVFAVLDREFADGRVRPSRQSEGTLGELVIARNRAAPEPGPDEEGARAEPPADVPCPYPGLEPFRAEESRHFFGRDELNERLLDAVTGPGDGPVVLVGASGAGKSSLLRAGLLAGLERRHLERRHAEGDPEVPWPAVLLPAPGERPLDALAEVWAGATGRARDDVRDALDEGRLPPALPGRPACGLLVVDQFEEVFAHRVDPHERGSFIAALAGGGGTGARPRVVLGLRADHYGSCLAHPDLERALERGQLTVAPMRERELRTAVDGPAAVAGLRLERGLTERLLHDLREGRPGDDTAGALPFLAHVLRETWQRRSGTRLTLAGYEAVGGIWRSVATTTEDLYEELDDEQRATLRKLLPRMVHLAPDGTGIRSAVRDRVPLATLLDGLPPNARDLCDRLAERRLITVDRDSAQIAHEALLREWPQLRRWIEQDAATLLLRQELRAVADVWHAAERDPAYLYRGSRLQEVLELGELPERERVFVAASEETEERERHREARGVTALRRSLGAVAVALCLALIATAVAWVQLGNANEQRRNAEQQGELATHRALLAQAESARATDPRESLRLAMAAHALRPTAEAREALYTTLATQPFRGADQLETADDASAFPGVTVLGADGRTLAGLSDEEDLALWDVGPGSDRRAPLAHLPCRTDSYSGEPLALGGPDSATLATLCGDGAVSLWDIAGFAEGAEPERLASLGIEGASGEPTAVGLSPDGGTLAAIGWEHESGETLVLWDISDPRSPRRLSVTEEEDHASAVTFGPDGRTLAVQGFEGVRVWDVSDPARPRAGGWVDEAFRAAVVFSADGGLLAVGEDRAIRLFDVNSPGDPEELAEWTAHTETIGTLAFSPDGRRLASAGFDPNIALWDVRDPREPVEETRLMGHGYIVEALAFDPEGRSLLSVDGIAFETIRWDLADLRGIDIVPEPILGTARAWPTGGGGTTLAVGQGPEVRLLDMTDPAAPGVVATLRGRPESGVIDVAFSADGGLLAALHGDGELALWNVTDPAEPRQLGQLDVEEGVVDSLALSPDGSLLAHRGDNVLVWDVSDPARPSEVASFESTASVGDLAFLPDNRRLLIPESTGVSLWDVSTGDAVELDRAQRPGDPAVLAPDGATVVTEGWLGSIESNNLLLWDVEGPGAPEVVGSTEPGGDVMSHLAFHPGGDLVLGAANDGTVRVWAVGERAEPHVAFRLPTHEDAVLDAVFSPDGRYLVTASGGGSFVYDLGDHPAIAADTVGMACRVAGGGLHAWEWAELAPDIPFRESCPAG
ncbi:WD40 repeat domain-containing protein [Streptomyces radicis]|uniref:WD40 repeat domain-containing protein n=1 Tax=Streptomyces radicis TaxID=1750517 RepID=UPI0011C3A153|nr:WD40 repeat domain-containing protein [Streptomyces radicis]